MSVSRRIDTSSRFPHYVTDDQQEAMAYFCPGELEVWRIAVAYHASLPSVSKKLEGRRDLEACYDRLKLSWDATCQSMACEVVAAA